MKKFSQMESQNEGLKEKIVGGLAGLSMLVSSCQSITPEEKKRLQIEIEQLNKQQENDKKMVDYYDAQSKDKMSKVRELEDEISELEKKLGIIKSGKKPKYILKLHFQEHKMEISLDRIDFDFEVPVDEEFYKESKIGDQLGEGSRSFKIGHSGDITVVDKRIE